MGDSMDNRGLRILVVDDDPAIRRSLQKQAESLGLLTLTAGDGGDGLVKHRDFDPDLVIAGWRLPTVDGIVLARAIRSESPGKRPYIILIAPLDEAQMPEALAAGIDDFIDKPLRNEVVAARLKLGLRILQLQRDAESQAADLRHHSEQLARSNLRFRELAITDELTGLPNRRHAMDRIQQEWAAASRRHSPLSCLLVDLDGLQRINKAHGYERGDVVLKTIGALMKSMFRAQDTVCRVSGDEFLVICPDTPLEAAIACAGRLLTTVGAFGIHADGCPFGLSVGAAERRPGIASAQALVDLAERGMRHARRHGRNRVYSIQDKDLRVIDGLGDACQLCLLRGEIGKRPSCRWRTPNLAEDRQSESTA